MHRTYRVVVVDLGAVARSLRDAGFEVIDAGLLDAAPLAEACLQEDADAVVLPRDVAALRDALAERGLSDVVVLEATAPDGISARLEQLLDGP